jgi:heme/copper-type cytochrome/quinol oxidase subunit 2
MSLLHPHARRLTHQPYSFLAMMYIALLIDIFLFVIVGAVLLVVFYYRGPNGPPGK